MFKRFVFASLFLGLAYLSFITFRIWFQKVEPVQTQNQAAEEEEVNKVYSFSFSKYSTAGKKELEIEGDTANILDKTVNLSNVIAKAYAEDTPVTITADQGVFDKGSNTVHLKENVVATTNEGARLFSPTLDIIPGSKSLQTEDAVTVKKDNIDVDGIGATGDSDLKKVKFHKNVTVVIQNDDPNEKVPTVITCEGPLNIDYDRNIAYFKKNVVVTDKRGKMTADEMDVYYDKSAKQVDRIHSRGNVVITNPDGNATYSDELIYYAKEGRVVIGGDSEGVFVPGSENSLESNGGPLF